MESLNNEKFGQFLLKLRQAKNYTQKEVAEQLGVSDKAVSKWERGLSFPDITLLEPIANFYGVSLTELYHSEKIDKDEKLDMDAMDAILTNSLQYSNLDYERIQMRSRMRNIFFLLVIVIVGFELVLELNSTVIAYSLFQRNFSMMIVAFILLVYFTFFVKQKLPVYYDQNKINFYSHFGVRIHLVGLSFNNNNWQYIIDAICYGAGSYLVISPILVYLQSAFQFCSPSIFATILMLYLFVSLLVPAYIVGILYK